MEPLSALTPGRLTRARALLCDIGDMLAEHGRLPFTSYVALERIRQTGLIVVPVTGRPAGWCDLIARQWPVDSVAGENGALWFARDADWLVARHWKSLEERRADRARLDDLADEILAAVPGCRLASDQAYRASDLAIDFCEDVPPLSTAAIDAIVARFAAAGATVRISSIHVNGWFGFFDKLAMARRMFAERFALDLDQFRDEMVFIGDSPNDAPMFAHLPLAVGVANACDFLDRLPHAPAFVTQARSAAGFCELAEHILAARI